MDAFGITYDILATMTIKGEGVGKRFIKFEAIPQKEESSCGPGAVSNFLRLIGREDLLVTDLHAELKYDPSVGTLIEDIISFFENNGVEYEEKTLCTLQDLEVCLSQGKVCLVEYQAWGTEEEKDKLLSGHYSIVFCMDEENVYLVDPGFEVDKTLDIENAVTVRRREDFYKRWFDGEPGGRYDHWMVSAKCVL